MKSNSQKIIIRTIQFSVTVLIIALFVGCSDSQPSAGDGERFIRHIIDEQSEGIIKLVSFKKTNGQKGEERGVPFYFMVYQVKIEFTNDCKWLTPDNINGARNFFGTIPPSAHNTISDHISEGKWVKKGDRGEVNGKIIFTKTEQGWEPELMDWNQ